MTSNNFITIASLASSTDDSFDYQNQITFGNESEIRAKYGDLFFEEFASYFENEWYGAIGDVFQQLFTPDLISDAIRHAAKAAAVELVDTGNWDGESVGEESAD